MTVLHISILLRFLNVRYLKKGTLLNIKFKTSKMCAHNKILTFGSISSKRVEKGRKLGKYLVRLENGMVKVDLILNSLKLWHSSHLCLFL